VVLLHWVKQHLCVGDTHTDSDATPKAFVVDRHDGQLAALRKVFPGSRIVFCAKHLGENIRRGMGTQLPAVGAFWDLIHETIDEQMLVQKVETESENCAQGTRRRHMLRFLEANLDRF
jgi:hypothetical protein